MSRPPPNHLLNAKMCRTELSTCEGLDRQSVQQKRPVSTELLMGLEPMTSSLPRKCSTTELQQHFTDQSRRAGEGNRTLVFSLEGCCSTIELHPQIGLTLAQEIFSRSKAKNTYWNDRIAPSVFFLSNGCFVHISFPDSPNLIVQSHPPH